MSVQDKDVIWLVIRDLQHTPKIIFYYILFAELRILSGK